MNESFELPVTFNGKDLTFRAILIQFGYSYKIEVDVNGMVIAFEKDEERNWRAILSSVDIELNKAIDKNLIAAIVDSLDSNL